jgi:hypothetical protein
MIKQTTDYSFSKRHFCLVDRKKSEKMEPVQFISVENESKRFVVNDEVLKLLDEERR